MARALLGRLGVCADLIRQLALLVLVLVLVLVIAPAKVFASSSLPAEDDGSPASFEIDAETTNATPLSLEIVFGTRWYFDRDRASQRLAFEAYVWLNVASLFELPAEDETRR